jgi:methionine synthase I (cobalamin-dependent)
MKKIIQDLLSKRPVLIDGSWGTQLQELGLESNECPDSWNLTHPDLVEKVAKSYVNAGSRIILTNTFRSNRIALQGFGLGDKVKEINVAGVRISKLAASHLALVFASVGPTGKMLMTGEITESEMLDIFTEQMDAIREAGADGIAIETMSDLTEAKIALEAAKHTELPVMVSMVYDSGKDKDRTMMGDTPENIAQDLTISGADIIGTNCGQGIDGFVSICKRLKASTNLPVWIKPNAGLPELKNGKVIYKTTANEFSKHIPALIDAGVDFIGGCCGTSPYFIEVIKQKLVSK